MLGIKYTMSKRYISHRWLSVHDVAHNFLRMADVFTEFYFSLMSRDDATHYLLKVVEIYLPQESKARIHEIQNMLRGKKMTSDVTEQKKRIYRKLSQNRKTTRLVASFYTSALLLLKRYVVLFQKKRTTTSQAK